MLEISYHGSDGHPLYAYALEPIESWSANKPPVVLLHAGGPDHRSLLPLAKRLAPLWNVVLPDIRGYGRSVCTDPTAHTWAQYADDAIALLGRIKADRAFLVGVGIGTTIALRVAAAHSQRLAASVLISVEDIEDDDAKAREIELLEDFGRRVREDGLAAAWESILGFFPPIVGAMVRDAIPRADAASIAAAAAIGYDRSFRSVEELAGITTPTLVVPGIDVRHPLEVAKKIVAVMPNARLAPVSLSKDLLTADDFAKAFAGIVGDYFQGVEGG